MNWTADMEETLRAGWLEGLTPKTIASRLGVPISDAAVRKRAWRLGLPHHGLTVAQLRRRFRGPPNPKPQPVLKLGPQSDPKPWEQRGPRECAFLMGDPDQRLACCAPVKSGSRRPYCEFHLDLMVRPPCST